MTDSPIPTLLQINRVPSAAFLLCPVSWLRIVGWHFSVAGPADSVYLARLHSLDALHVTKGGLGGRHRLLSGKKGPKRAPGFFRDRWANDVYAKFSWQLDRNAACERFQTAINHCPGSTHTNGVFINLPSG